jgi:hypothetical protein
MTFGTLYLIPVPLSPEAADASFTPYALSVIHSLDEFIVENGPKIFETRADSYSSKSADFA